MIGPFRLGGGRKGGLRGVSPRSPVLSSCGPEAHVPPGAQTASDKHLHKSCLAESPVLGPAARDLTAAPWREEERDTMENRV